MADIQRVFDIPYYQQKKYPLADALVSKENGIWRKISTDEYIKKANTLSRGLLKMGIQPEDKIAIISTNNRWEWSVVDFAVLQIGAKNVPIYPNISTSDYEYILEHCEASYCFISDQTLLNKINEIKDKLTHLKEIYSFDPTDGCKQWTEILKIDQEKDNQQKVEYRKSQVKSSDLATIIYTSGTTGKPKGVMLSHHNLVSNAIYSSRRVPMIAGSGKKSLSFLPVCHVYERMVLYMYQYLGISIHFAESIDKLSENLKEVQPHIITAVPRLLEKVFSKIIAKGQSLTGIKRKLFFWSLNLADQYKPYKANGWFYEFKLSIARKLVFSKWKDGLGGNIEVISSGSAALQSKLSRIYNAAGIAVMEGYGLTETSPVVSVNEIENNGFRIGTVGKVLEETEIKIANDGEVMIKGPQIMMGYYKDEKETKKSIKNGYFYTGDIGEIDADGFLTITDRKKEIFKTSGGKYISPQALENALKQSPFIEQAMVIGENQKMPAAIIQPCFEYIIKWGKSSNINIPKDFKELVKNPEVLKKIDKEIKKINTEFGNWEKIKSFRLTWEVWNIEDGHLTPTMKVKRRVILEKYQNLYLDIYKE